MNRIFNYINYSKQAFHQKMDRQLRQQEQLLLLLPIVAELRLEHPEVGARQLYEILQPSNVGRDKFEQFCFANGYKLQRAKAYKKTTNSNGVIRFPNLVLGTEFTDVNQAWSSDITYYQIGNKFYYLTFILDLYSRFIVGFSVSKNLSTEETTIPALTMALQQRNPPSSVIFHSDGGSQYYCKTFLKLTQTYQMKNSMCDIVYENSHAERINRTIKNQYLKGYNPQSFLSLIQMTQRAVNNYNKIRPHKSLKKMSPAAFEGKLPAGGSSLTNDNFCIDKSKSKRHQKNYHLPTRFVLDPKTERKRVDKTVNVF